MALPCYIAMTNAEFAAAEIIPSHPAWMACHFSSYGNGLSNLPADLPPGSMVILNDEMPISGHKPEVILQELKELNERLLPSCYLLDFERPENEEAAGLAEMLCLSLPCPVGVSHLYADKLDCPVFLPPPPLHRPLEEYLSAWNGREIWLEISQETALITITADGSEILDNAHIALSEPVFISQELACKYHIELLSNTARFHMQRDMELYRQNAEHCGIACFIGLYQQLNEKPES